jgi:Family of unknown function (DUF6350)
MPSFPEDDADLQLANRETVRLPVQRRPRPAAKPTRRAPLALAATVTTVWAALVSLAPMLVVVALVHALDSSGASTGVVARLGLAAWLLAHGVPVEVGIGPIALAPLALSTLAVWRVYRAGVHTARAIGARRGRAKLPPVRAGLAVGLVYGVLGALTAALASHDGVHISVVRAALTLFLLGSAAGLIGALAEARLLGRLVVALPRTVRDGIRTGIVAALLILGGGAALAGMAVAIHGGDASQILHDYRTGVTGQIGLTLVCALFAPNLAIWAASYLVGPGFMLGTGTAVTAAEIKLGPLPALPMLAGLPSHPLTGWFTLLLGVPVAAALVAGWLLARRALRNAPADLLDPRDGWTRLLASSAVAGPVAGALLGLAGLASGGSLGNQHLAVIGPHAGMVALIATMVVATGAALAASATKIFLGVRRSRS